MRVVGQPPHGGLGPQVHGHGHAAHVPDLQVEHDQVGLVASDRGRDLGAGAHPDHGGRLVGDGRLDLVGDGVGVGGDEHNGHGGKLACGRVEIQIEADARLHALPPER